MTDPDYTAMLATARRRPDQWRIFVILAVGMFVVVIAQPMFFLALGSMAPELNAIRIRPDDTPGVGVTPGGAFVVLSAFLVMIGATVTLARRLHGRGLRDISGPAGKLRRDFWVSLRWGAAIMALTFVLPWDAVDFEFVEQYTGSQWLFWLPFALLALMVQVTAEELFFRGYLQTQISGATGSHFWGIVGSALVFGVAHLGAVGGEAIFPVLWAIAFGIVAGDLTQRTGSIGPAIALHLLNNAGAVLFAPQEGSLSGFGNMVRTGDPSAAFGDPLVMSFEALRLLVLWLAVRLVLRR